jgi:hypothetical protein
VDLSQAEVRMLAFLSDLCSLNFRTNDGWTLSLYASFRIVLTARHRLLTEWPILQERLQ